jgi:hypothetical protein
MSESDSKIPGLLTKSLLEKALGNKCQSPVKILDYQVSLASKKGDNYTSNIYRATVNYEVSGRSENTSLIVKYSIEDEESRRYYEVMKLMDKEIEMYEKILPKFQEISGVKFSADCYYIIKDPAIYVFEDLNASGYKVADRLAGLDLDHSRILLEKLGYFHAVSMVLAGKCPGIFGNFSFGMFNEDDELMYEFMDNTFGDIIEAVKEWEGFEEITRKLQKIKENFRSKIFKFLEQTTDFPVLNHGDVWTNNVMFKPNTDSQVPEDIVFVDYQIGFYSSLGIDFNYFLYTSPSVEVRSSCEEEFLKTYYGALAGNLKKFDYPKIPTFDDVKAEIKRYEFYGEFFYAIRKYTGTPLNSKKFPIRNKSRDSVDLAVFLLFSAYF